MNYVPHITLDANIFIRAALGRRVRQIISEYATTASFFAPEVAHADARRWLPTILARRGARSTTVEHALNYLDELRRVVRLVPVGAYEHLHADALAGIGGRDADLDHRSH